MDELEQRLRSRRLAQPSAALDRRINAAFETAIESAAGEQRSRFWWWLVPASGAVGAAMLLLVALPRVRPLETPEVYRIRAEGPLREMLVNAAPAREGVVPPFSVRISTN